ncbi:MAG TPA: carboxylating nicotinate-nucleotide diphosphorylase [Thermoplasmata archaeon]
MAEMKQRIKEYLREDVGSGDITSALVIPSDAKAHGMIICKEACILAGGDEAAEVFRTLGARVLRRRRDGSTARTGDIVLEVQGSARALLAGERLALNMLMRMSGIATITRTLVAKCRRANPKAKVAATRKTTPGFREFEKRAVVLGGGIPHRSGLFDAILIKNNHIRIAGGVREALARARRGARGKSIEIEVETLEQGRVAVEEGADVIMLDNFTPARAAKASAELRRIKPSIIIEISGGITPENIGRYARFADIISLGRLTYSVKAIDFSMRIEKA